MAKKTLKEIRLEKRRFWKVHIRAWERRLLAGLDINDAHKKLHYKHVML